MKKFEQAWFNLMNKPKIMGVWLLGISNAVAMEQWPVAGSSGQAGPSTAVSLVNKLYEEERFFGSGDLSPRSEREKFYQNMLERGALGARDTAEAKYRLALIYTAKNRQACDIIPLLEAVSADGTVDQCALTDARYRLVNLYSDAQDPDCSKRYKLLQALALAGNLFGPRALTTLKLKLAFTLANGRRRYCDGDLAAQLFQEALESGLLDKSEIESIMPALEDLKNNRLGQYLLDYIITREELDAELLAYAQYRLAAMLIYVRGVSRDKHRAVALLDKALASGALGEPQKIDALKYRNLCFREAVQDDIEAKLAQGGLVGHDLAINQCLLAMAYKDDCEDYGDQRARELFGEAIASNHLLPAELARARYHLACLYDGHWGQPEMGKDDLQACELLQAAMASGFLGSACKADAQYRLARLLIIRNTGHCRAVELLSSALKSSRLSSELEQLVPRILDAMIGLESGDKSIDGQALRETVTDIRPLRVGDCIFDGDCEGRLFEVLMNLQSPNVIIRAMTYKGGLGGLKPGVRAENVSVEKWLYFEGLLRGLSRDMKYVSDPGNRDLREMDAAYKRLIGSYPLTYEQLAHVQCEYGLFMCEQSGIAERPPDRKKTRVLLMEAAESDKLTAAQMERLRRKLDWLNTFPAQDYQEDS